MQNISIKVSYVYKWIHKVSTNKLALCAYTSPGPKREISFILIYGFTAKNKSPEKETSIVRSIDLVLQRFETDRSPWKVGGLLRYKSTVVVRVGFVCKRIAFTKK